MTTEIKQKNRIFYFDALRALAIICVITIHVFASCYRIVVGELTPIPTYKYIYTHIMGVWFRIGVDLFLALSGALSLGRVWTIKGFLSKRIPRIVAPFLFWGISLSLLVIACSYYFNWDYISSFDLMSILNYVYLSLMCETTGFIPYWFFWMILGTYFIMPVLNKWLLHSDLKEAEYFLVFWLITCLFDSTLAISFPIKLTYFTSPIGFVVLGYYLRHTERRLLNNPYFDMILILLSVVALSILSYSLSDAHTFHLISRYSIMNAFEAAGVFLLFKNAHKLPISFNFIRNPKSILRRLIQSLAKYSYGIYLIHSILILIFISKIHFPGYNIKVLVTFILAVGVPLLLMAALNKVPYLNRVIGAK